MAFNNWLNRTTKEYILNVSPGAMQRRYGGTFTAASNENWIYDPDVSAVAGQPIKYWKIVGDNVLLMNASEQAAADQAALDTSRDNIMEQFDVLEDIIRALALVIMDELNLLRAQHGMPARNAGQIRGAIRNKLGS